MYYILVWYHVSHLNLTQQALPQHIFGEFRQKQWESLFWSTLYGGESQVGPTSIQLKNLYCTVTCDLVQYCYSRFHAVQLHTSQSNRVSCGGASLAQCGLRPRRLLSPTDNWKLPRRRDRSRMHTSRPSTGTVQSVADVSLLLMLTTPASDASSYAVMCRTERPELRSFDLPWICRTA